MYWKLFHDMRGMAEERLFLSDKANEIERERRVSAERKVAELEAKAYAASKAIESSSLPWYPKSEQMEARFEADAMDKLNNPEISWDSIPGLGATS